MTILLCWLANYDLKQSYYIHCAFGWNFHFLVTKLELCFDVDFICSLILRPWYFSIYDMKQSCQILDLVKTSHSFDKVMALFPCTYCKFSKNTTLIFCFLWFQTKLPLCEFVHIFTFIWQRYCMTKFWHCLDVDIANFDIFYGQVMTLSWLSCCILKPRLRAWS